MNKEKIKSFINKFDVLYAEDEPEIREKVSRMFGELFKKVDVAQNGAEALEIYNNYYKENNKYHDIVISDINMPVMGGIELSKNIKQINNSQVILIISAYNESNILQDLINIGVNYFINKPVKFDELINILDQINKNFSRSEVKQKQVDEVMKMNQEFEALLKGYDSMVIASRTDHQGKITYVSKAFEKISGYSAQELIGHTHSILKHPDMNKKTFENIWGTISQGKIWKGNIKNRKKNGDFFWATTSIGPYFNKNGEIIGYNSIREDITDQIRARDLHKRVNLLLRHANDGYMLFNEKMEVEKGYSDACLEIFDKESIDHANIAKLLFEEDEKKLSLFTNGIKRLFNTNEKNKRELFLSLLPKQSFVKGKYISISYKNIDLESIMVVVQDITDRIRLKSELEKQQNYQKMIIQVIANIHDFLELKKDFEQFFKELYVNPKESIIDLDEDSKNILRKLHTFKGLFHQMQMYYTPDAIHNLESCIIQMVQENELKKNITTDIDIRRNFNKDLKVIEEMLGKDYFQEQEKAQQNYSMLKRFKYKLKNLINDPVNINFKVQTLISQIDLLSYIDVEEALKKHIDLVAYLSELLEKPTYPLEIKGETGLKVPPSFKPFFRNLVHVYKNSVDHGIEDTETRVLNGKDEKGQICCNYYYKNNHIHIFISDDGAGINIEKIVQKAVQKNIITKEESLTLNEKEKIDLIFKDSLSTKDISNEISGRGVGMASLKESCEDLGGVVTVKNIIGKGVEYYFKIPMTKLLDTYEADDNLEELIRLLEAVANRIKLFMTKELDMDIIDSRYIDQIDLSNKVNITIGIKSDVIATTLSFSFTKNFIKKFSEVYFPEMLQDNEIFEQNLEEIAKEIINTLVGLSIQDFPTKYLDGMLTTPELISEENLQKIIEHEHKVLAILIQTNYGNFICKLIQK